MANTPEGTPYIESSDLVANYPAASLALANRLDLVGVLPFANAAARTTAIPSPTNGQFTYLQDTNKTEFYNGSSFQSIGNTILSETITTGQSTTSTSYTDLATVGPTVTMTTGTSVLIIMSAIIEASADAIAGQMTFAVSGATTIAAADTNRIVNQNQYNVSVSRAFILTGLNAGSNVFTAKYKTSSGTGYFSSRTITIVSL